jgi:hypothetical protein
VIAPLPTVSQYELAAMVLAKLFRGALNSNRFFIVDANTGALAPPKKNLLLSK